ncbi:pectate lyase family protein [Alteromonas gilva]|uniref:Pectate lyase C n=1 Tax=Alteromonas gilva TaxID=2987522 RepID=A0ABT5KZS3_9ALTE|nr:pectate lyase C [Alteromonas gilva]MDC8829689.1 pectate lyase C [Alteromonas gilva]
MKRLLTLMATVTIAFFTCVCNANPEPAFEGALGFGQFTQGGTGGKRYVVSSLADDPQHPQPGTLRYAVKQKGPRVVEFSVSGIIHLKAELEIKHDYITINGQSSPGGIVVTGAQTAIKASQVIIRYMRFRPGHWQQEGDALTARGQQHIMIDHCSLSWANDEVASFYNNRWFTLQHSIISESLKEAGHHKGSHGYGGIWGGASASFIRNVIAHHDSRNPRINGYRLKAPYTQPEELTDIRNNVIFNWGDNSGYGAEGSQFNLVNNYYIPGPASQDRYFFQFWSKPDVPEARAYVAGNVMITEPDFEQNNRRGLVVKNQKKLDDNAVNALLKSTLTEHPFATFESGTLSAYGAYQMLIERADVGANRNAKGAFQDSVDTRIINEISTRKPTHNNGLINSELTVLGPEGWANYAKEFTR